MRVAIIVNSYPPRMGGLELHVQNLAHGLAAQGHRVWVLTIAEETGSRHDDNVAVLTGRSHLPIAEVISFPSVGATRKIATFLRRNRIDIASTHTRFFPLSFAGLRAAQAAGVPVIHTEHGSDFVASRSPVIALGSRAVDLTLGRYVLRHANQVLAVSPQAADFVERLSGVHATVFYNAITPPDPSATHADRPHHLVFVGRVVAGKGWEVFLDAIAALRAEGMTVDAELLGEGAELDIARRRAAELGLDAVVRIPGRVGQEEVRQSLDGATLVNPTVLSEGFQTTLLEAIAEGGRVVTFEVPGAQLLRDSGAPVIVCPERTATSLVVALKEMISRPLPPAGKELITPWTWPVRAREYSQIASEVVDRAAGRD